MNRGWSERLTAVGARFQEHRAVNILPLVGLRPSRVVPCVGTWCALAPTPYRLFEEPINYLECFGNVDINRNQPARGLAVDQSHILPISEMRGHLLVGQASIRPILKKWPLALVREHTQAHAVIQGSTLEGVLGWFLD